MTHRLCSLAVVLALDVLAGFGPHPVGVARLC